MHSPCFSSILNRMNPPLPKKPHLPSPLSSEHTSMSSRTVTLTMAVVKKVRHVRCGRQNDAASSIAKRTPPTGALKAAATPAHAPHVMRSLRSRSLVKSRSQFVPTLMRLDPPCERIAAMQDPV